MTALREYTTIQNNMITLQLPEEFNNKDVEVIIIAKAADNLGFLSHEVAKGMDAELSPLSHDEVFTHLKAKYAH